MAGEVTLVLEYGARASRYKPSKGCLLFTNNDNRCKRCKDGIAKEKLRAVKGKGSTRQLLHPRCFFDWLTDQIRGKDATQVKNLTLSCVQL